MEGIKKITLRQLSGALYDSIQTFLAITHERKFSDKGIDSLNKHKMLNELVEHGMFANDTHIFLKKPYDRNNIVFFRKRIELVKVNCGTESAEKILALIDECERFLNEADYPLPESLLTLIKRNVN
jgi:hypothetical protein